MLVFNKCSDRRMEVYPTDQQTYMRGRVEFALPTSYKSEGLDKILTVFLPPSTTVLCIVLHFLQTQI